MCNDNYFIFSKTLDIDTNNQLVSNSNDDKNLKYQNMNILFHNSAFPYLYKKKCSGSIVSKYLH